MEVCGGVGLECHGDRIPPEFLGCELGSAQKLLVAEMHTIEISNGDSGLDEGPEERPMTLEDFHSAGH